MRMETAAVRLAAKTSAGGGQVGEKRFAGAAASAGDAAGAGFERGKPLAGVLCQQGRPELLHQRRQPVFSMGGGDNSAGVSYRPRGTPHWSVRRGIRENSSLCIRVARDFPGIARRAADAPGSILRLGAPGWGKTTLLRDLIRQIGEKQCVSVVDERGELFPEGLERGKKTDVLTGCPKSPGIDMVLRTMGPDCIAVDEITAEADARALLRAANCGVRLLATAHGTSAADMRRRSVYRPLAESGVFQTILILRQDKSFRAERAAL